MAALYTPPVAYEGKPRRIADFLIGLARDPERLAAWRDGDEEGRRSILDTDTDLSPGQKKIVLSGDLARIQNALDYEVALGDSPALTEDPSTDAAPAAKTLVVTWRPKPRPTWGVDEQ